MLGSSGLWTGYVVTVSYIFIYVSQRVQQVLRLNIGNTILEEKKKRSIVSFCSNLIIWIKCTSHIKKKKKSSNYTAKQAL